MTLIKKKIHPTRMAALLVLVAVLRSTANVGMESRSDGNSLSVGESVSDFPCFIACLRAARNLKFRRVMTTSGRSAKPALEMVGVVGQKLSRRIWHALETLTLSHYTGSSFRQSETENPMALSPLTLVSYP